MQRFLQLEKKAWLCWEVTSPAQSLLTAEVCLDFCANLQGRVARPVLLRMVQKVLNSVPKLSFLVDLLRHPTNRVHIKRLGLYHACSKVYQPPCLGYFAISRVAFAVAVDLVQPFSCYIHQFIEETI